MAIHVSPTHAHAHAAFHQISPNWCSLLRLPRFRADNAILCCVTSAGFRLCVELLWNCRWEFMINGRNRIEYTTCINGWSWTGNDLIWRFSGTQKNGPSEIDLRNSLLASASAHTHTTLCLIKRLDARRQQMLIALKPTASYLCIGRATCVIHTKTANSSKFHLIFVVFFRWLPISLLFTVRFGYGPRVFFLTNLKLALCD